MAAVYAIRCHPNGKQYIGSAANWISRTNAHFGQLRSESHPNRGLQRDWATYGPEGFTAVLVEDVDDADRLLERERHWIDAYGTFDPAKGYNLVPASGAHCKSLRPRSVPLIDLPNPVAKFLQLLAIERDCDVSDLILEAVESHFRDATIAAKVFPDA